ncbi:4'-phosphopantetheinyl transferase superfamily protein [Streptomyces sp. NPDC086554]|uniref:4'-phosphopantetheinyl transferase family protein n=1 Tax=Streptomyces sp. NPDC086554 TaxID=3154864 RepID=UPI00344304BE
MNDVAVRTLRIPDHAAAAAARAEVLDADEASRAAEFQDSAARERYVTAHVGLRVLLGARLEVAPQSVEFVREPCGMPDCELPHGRPAVAGRPDVRFSLSHAGDFALYALAESPVGADIESAELARDGFARMLRRLHPAEQQAVAALSVELREAALLGCWVRKEAYLKGIGTGLPGGVGRRHVGLPAEFAPRDAPPVPAGWSVVDVPAPDGYRAAIAVRRQDGAPDGDAPRLRAAELRLE